MPNEICMNPWKKCTNTDIELYIMVKGQKLSICKSCWTEVAEKKEWYSNSIPLSPSQNKQTPADVLEQKILSMISAENTFTGRSLSKTIQEKFGEEGLKISRSFWKKGFIGRTKDHGLRLTKKGEKLLKG